MKNKKQFRQGDVLIERVGELPKKLKKQEKQNRVILAHGEVTGHAHEIAAPELATLEEIKDALKMLGDLPDAGTMTNVGLELAAAFMLKLVGRESVESGKPLDSGKTTLTEDSGSQP